jgi:hypothetical protein
MSTASDIRHELDARYASIPAGEIRADLRDLAAIGLASSIPDVSKADMRELVQDALASGRSWDEIGQRLGVTAAKARRIYGNQAKPTQVDTSVWAELALSVLEALQRALDRAEDTVRAHSRR